MKMNPLKVKVDASQADEKEKTGSSANECNCVKIYVTMDLAKDSKRIKDLSEISDEKSPIYENYQDLIARMFELPGVAFLWVYPNAIHFHKKVAADWRTWEKDGVYDMALETLEDELAARYPGREFTVSFIKGCEFPTTI